MSHNFICLLILPLFLTYNLHVRKVTLVEYFVISLHEIIRIVQFKYSIFSLFANLIWAIVCFFVLQFLDLVFILNISVHINVFDGSER